MRQAFTFAGVGVVGTGVQYAVLLWLVQFGHLMPVVASTFGFAGGALVNYILNYYITFRSTKRHVVAMCRFFSIAAAGVVLNGALMYAGTRILGVHYLVAQVMATGMVFASNFLGNRLWTFADSP